MWGSGCRAAIEPNRRLGEENKEKQDLVSYDQEFAFYWEKQRGKNYWRTLNRGVKVSNSPFKVFWASYCRERGSTFYKRGRLAAKGLDISDSARKAGIR